MEEHFAYMTKEWFKRAHVYTGSLGTLRYRFAMDEGAQSIAASTYSGACFEKAQDVETQAFAWTEEGAQQLRAWLEEAYARYSAQ